MNLKQIRDNSLKKAWEIGVEIPPTLPLLDANLKMKNTEEVISQMLVVHTMAAVAYGFETEKAIEWLRNEGISSRLTARESLFLQSGKDSERFKQQIEGLWALAWVMRIFEGSFDFTKDCDSNFVRLLPNLKTENAANFRKKISPRPLLEVLGVLDLSYCLHWAIRQSKLSGQLILKLKESVVLERRRALEWLFSAEGWDEITLDT
ncbi:MAG: hypothetical protein A2849_00980 [Candidatus Taylorbacteria bacterium RIFCSPHIGHO2_01_FULL_51_15]|uniref:DUF4272 domain-containing protein n=1 Tax=Candidatus Taylorbacteria bacterium RIFCSPHIGHO2_01_FULL_51_15 TaxID=1802304 RepID=A0A1G2M932_9BACT|nr:MAG: hypothetical protein A2849_00980 [Candidatus Taylorbacteria bacterium RIFCSPHIGHO2_01_FULL_51_15]